MSRLKDALPYDVAAKDLTDVSVAGYLDKKRPNKKFMSVKYQRRWCVVYGNYFMYYFSPDDKEQRGSFSLSGYKFLPCPGFGEFGFSLVSKEKRPFEFLARNEEDFNRWKTAIKKGISLTKRSIAPITPANTKRNGQMMESHNSKTRPEPNFHTLPTRSSSHPSLLDITTKTTLPPRSASPLPNQPHVTKTSTLPTKPIPVSPVPSPRLHRPKESTNNHGTRTARLVPESITQPKVDNNTHLYTRPTKGLEKKSPSPQLKPAQQAHTQFMHSPKLARSNAIDEYDSESTSDSLDLGDEVDDAKSDDTDDDDDDTDGYIRTDKLNCHRVNVTNVRDAKAKSYTADDYMTVLPDIVPPKPTSKQNSTESDRSASDKCDETDGRKFSSEDVNNDYMTVLPDQGEQRSTEDEIPYVDCDSLLRSSKHQKIYSSVSEEKNSDLNENHIEKLYHSVKRVPRTGLVHQRSESDYASVNTWGIQLPMQRKTGSASSSSDDDDDDYTMVDETVLGTKPEGPALHRQIRHDSDDDSCSSSGNDEQSDSDDDSVDYERVDELKINDSDVKSKLKSNEALEEPATYERPVPAARNIAFTSSKNNTPDPIYANFD